MAIATDMVQPPDVHDHVLFLYKDCEEKLSFLVPFIQSGLAEGARCLYLAPPNEVVDTLQALQDAGVEVGEVRARGALVVVEAVAGSETLDLERVVKESEAAGFATLRVCQDKGGLLNHGLDPMLLLEQETTANVVALGREVIVACLVDLKRTYPEIVHNLFLTHPKIFFNNTVCVNRAYQQQTVPVPPQHDSEVEQLLKGMAESEVRLKDLEMQRALVKAVFENTPDGIYIKDASGRYLLMNPAAAAYFGKTVDEVIGHTDSEVMSPAVAAMLKDADAEVMVADHPLTFEWTQEQTVGGHTISAIKGTFRDALGGIAGTFGISRDITARKRLENELIEYQEQLRYLVTEMSFVEERERRQIASILHDDIGDSLAVLKLCISNMESGEGLDENMEQAKDTLDAIIRRTRSLTAELSPPVLYDLGLEPAVRSLCRTFTRRHGIEVAFQDDDKEKPLTENMRVLLYQAVRELLLNMSKHSHAQQGKVSVALDGKYVRIIVSDNGIGFDHGRGARPGGVLGFGLFSIRERLKFAGGCFDLVSAPGSGTTVTMEAPLGN